MFTLTRYIKVRSKHLNIKPILTPAMFNLPESIWLARCLIWQVEQVGVQLC